jgi:AcrR family transcriptional regulator
VPSSPAVERRTQQKQANRQQMIESASRLFATVGYAGTTMEAVAASSGMSVQGVYFAFHTKANLLDAAFHQASPGPMSRTTEEDPDRALVAMVEELVRSLEATGPLALAAAAAAPGDDAAAEVHRSQEERRAQAATDLVQRLRARRPLARGVTVRRCSDVVFGLLSPQLHALLVRDRGWSQKRYAAWAADAIGRALWG